MTTPFEGLSVTRSIVAFMEARDRATSRGSGAGGGLFKRSLSYVQFSYIEPETQRKRILTIRARLRWGFPCLTFAIAEGGTG